MKSTANIIIAITLVLTGVFIGVFIGRNMFPSTIYVGTDYPVNDMKIDLNTAGVDELIQLPGVGKILAERIIDYRTRYGRYVFITELLQVEGVTQQLFNNIKDYLVIGGAK